MNEENTIVGLLLIIVVFFAAFIAYDIKTGHKLEKIFIEEKATNWPWDDKWSDEIVPNVKKPIDTSDSQTVAAKPEVQKTASTYAEAVQMAKDSKEANQLILVYFKADWCGPCKTMKSQVLPSKEIQEQMKKYILVFVDADKDEDVVKKFKVAGLPYYVIINAKEENIKSGIGYKNVAAFSKWLGK